jgi:DNA repair ATPase RecN
MRTQFKLKKIRKTLAKITDEMDILCQDLEAIETDLMYLDKLQKDLNYNIKLLKQDEIITVITAYEQSVNQLNLVNTQITVFTSLKKQLKKRIREVIQHCEEYNKPNKVLEFKGRK